MPTFLALQCYKCSMMQVKHEKKSSNKWSCSVCNEKQSVRKVFATSAAAKDIRLFVQDYNLSRNIAQDRVLAELVEKADEGGDMGFMGTDAPSFNIFGDEFSQHHIKTESRWTEYLPPEEEGLHAEVSEDALDDAKFVTTIPEKNGRKPQGRAQAAAKEQNNRFSLQQPQGFSSTRGRVGKFSNKSINSVRKWHDDVQKENKSPSLWATRASSGSSSMLQTQQLGGYKVPQGTATDVSLHGRGSHLNGERAVAQENTGSKTNAASDLLSIGRKQKPVSKWATYLDSPEDVKDRRICTVAEEEKHVSKWAKYVDSNEMKPIAADSMVNSGVAARWGKFVDVSEDVFLKPGQPHDSSSIWLSEADSNLQCLNGLVKTELDELCGGDRACFSEEVDEEVHPLFS